MNGFTIRPAVTGDEVAIAATQIDVWADTYDGILPERLLRPWDGRQLAGIWRRRLNDATARAQTFVAEGGRGAVVGFGICGARRGSTLPTGGEISLLYLRREVQRRGIGRALIKTMATTLLERGHHSTGVWVLADNVSAVRFYTALGGLIAVERSGQFGGYRTHELGFVWPSDLLARSGALKGAAATGGR